MRCLKRNYRPFHYCLYSVATEIVDENGNSTGEYEVTYEEPVLMYANISPASGQAQTEQFGNLDSYDKVIVTDDMSCPIDEHTVLFVDKEPEFAPIVVPDVPTPSGTDNIEPTEPITDGDADGDGGDEPEPEPEAEPTPEPEPEPTPEPHGAPLYDYIVKRVAKSLNSISIAISKVKVS